MKTQLLFENVRAQSKFLAIGARGRYTPKSDGQAAPSDKFVRDIFNLLLFRKPVLAYAGAGLIGLCAAAGLAFSHPSPWLPDTFISTPAKSCSLPKSFWITTWDSTETDPANVVQHKQVQVTRCDADKIYGTYSYQAPSTGSGEIVGVRRMGGTWAFTYWSSQNDGPGLGTVIVRPLPQRDQIAGTVFMGHEDGHDCSCGGNYAAIGPYTTLPATVTESHDPPPDIEAQASKVKTQPQIKFFPEDVFPKARS